MTAHFQLSETEREVLSRMARRSGKTQEQVLHEAVSAFLACRGREDRLSLLRQARGIWKDREDLPDFGTLRTEWQRET